MEGGLAISCFTHVRAGVNSALTAAVATGDDAGEVVWESISNSVPQQMLTTGLGSWGDTHLTVHVNSG